MRKGVANFVKTHFYGRSDIGKVRSANQDSYIVGRLCDNAALCVVCDGMGGAKSGNVASECAAVVFAEKVKKYAAQRIAPDGIMELDSDDACVILDDAAHDANSAVYKKSQTSSAFRGMGTTLVAALICDDVAYVINVGDSRLYLISDNTITQITHDHSYVQHLIDSGSLTVEDARTHPYRNRITRAVGVGSDLEADIYSVDLSSLDCCYLLLCSDGLSGQLLPEDIYGIITDEAFEGDTEKELAEKTSRLIDAANAQGGPDNITALLVKCTADVPYSDLPYDDDSFGGEEITDTPDVLSADGSDDKIPGASGSPDDGRKRD